MEKKTPLQLQIQEPCTQSWSGMTPDDRGRFCGACSKTVVDFSSYTDQQLIEFFTERRTERVCGQFKAGQLDRPVHTTSRWWTWVRSVAALLLPFMLTAKADAQLIDSTAQIDKRNPDKVRLGQEPRVLGMVLPRQIKAVGGKQNPKADIDPRYQKGIRKEAILPDQKRKPTTTR